MPLDATSSVAARLSYRAWAPAATRQSKLGLFLQGLEDSVIYVDISGLKAGSGGARRRQKHRKTCMWSLRSSALGPEVPYRARLAEHVSTAALPVATWPCSARQAC